MLVSGILLIKLQNYVSIMNYRIYTLAIVYGIIIGSFFGLWLGLGIILGIIIGIAIFVLTIYSEKLKQKRKK